MYQKPKSIIGRRKKEATLLSTGRYSNTAGRTNLFPVSSRGYPMYEKGVSINVWEYLDGSNETAPIVPTVSKKDEKMFETKPSLKHVLLNMWDIFKVPKL